MKTPVPCLNYQRRETRLLESPYDTRCLNYSTMGLQSQLHCLNDCIHRFASSRLNLLPDDVSIFESNASTARVWRNSFGANSTISAALSTIRSSCNRKCSNKDCIHNSFQPRSYCDLVSPASLAFASFYLNAFIFTKLISTELHVSFCQQKLRHIYDHFFKFMIIMTCLICCVWQLQESTVQYMKYPTVSKVLIQIEDPISIPAVTLCKPLPTSQFDDITYALLFEEFENDSTYFVNHQILSEDVIINDHFCITVNPRINPKTVGDPRDSALMTFGIRNLRNKISNFRCLIHDANTHIHGQYTSYAILSLSNGGSQVVVSYTKFTSRLLPAPYDSMCRDYRDSEFQSQHHCIESCAIAHSLQNNIPYPSFMSAQ